MNDELIIPAERDLPPARLQRRKEHLVSEVGLSARDRSRRRRRWLVGALVPAAALLLGATGVATYVLTRPATHLESVGCYERADLGANTTIVSMDGRDPVAICAELWEDGDVGPGSVPELAACVLPSGAVGVFPRSGDETCNSLGLANLAAGFTESAKKVADLHAAVVARFAIDCFDEARARRLVESELAAGGFRGWQVEVAGGGFGDERPCASFGTDAARNVALVIAGERVQVACYERPDLPTEFVLAPANGTDPVALCTRLWREGSLGGERPAVACLLHASGVGVFPAAGREICTSFGPSVGPFPAG